MKSESQVFEELLAELKTLNELLKEKEANSKNNVFSILLASALLTLVIATGVTVGLNWHENLNNNSKIEVVHKA